MADPMTYNDPDRYVIVNPDNPKVVHQTWDAPLVDPETKQFITDDNGKIKVIRCINFGTKGLTQAQVDARIEVQNVDLVNRLENLTTTVNTFLTGDPDDNETLDKLSELVQYIDSHQDTIDALTTTYLTINDFNDFKETVVTTDYLDGKINEINLDLNTNYLTYDNITDDLGSLATAFIPGANFASVGTGAVGSTARFYADRQRGTKNAGLNYLLNLGMDATMAIPILGGVTKLARIPQAVAKALPTIMKAASVYGLGAGVIDTANKIKSGQFTVRDVDMLVNTITAGIGLGKSG